MGEISLTLILAMLFIVLLGLIPRRYWYVQVPAVLGWVLVWADGEYTGHWTDSAGVSVTGLSLLWLAMTGQRQRDRT